MVRLRQRLSDLYAKAFKNEIIEKEKKNLGLSSTIESSS